MKKIIKAFMVALVLAVGVFAAAGCGKADKTSIVGKWTHGNFIYTFEKDGKGSYDSSGTVMPFTYEAKDGNISILFDGNTAPFETTYTIEGKNLTIKDSLGNDVTYEKK